jgi:UDP-N-acetylmuramoyl-L-alanyl-D-glutamate--2,6-diaminopimelate ligase
MKKTLKQLLDGLPSQITGSADVAIEDIVFDSRQVKPGALFVALRGIHQNGNAFVPAAVKSGAAAVLTDSDLSNAGVPVVKVADAMQALAPLAERFWDSPSKKLFMVGITGTNGKTTTSYLIEWILQTAGWPTGVLGTINYRFGKETRPAPNTTPFASELQRFLSHVATHGGKACVMEVSSHALALGRVQGVEYDVAVFTNLTQDHLDFHKTMDDYFTAKAKLFEGLTETTGKPFAKRAILNADDPWSEKLRPRLQVPVWTYSVHGPADISVKSVHSDAKGSRLTVQVPGATFPLHLPLLGDYNISNALAAIGVGLSQGIPVETLRRALETSPGVPGRLERVEAGQPYTVVVDYAHTEDALRKVLDALRKLKPRKLITVFGCGGDRDRAKRPLMGEAAATLSDQVVVTSDNPRSEDPARIALDIEVGIRRVGATHYQIVLDRREAIAKALAIAGRGDIVLIAGKGHETYQILADRTIPFDDRTMARLLIPTLPSHA